jgi:hydrogenase nickel incorporation protein HypB
MCKICGCDDGAHEHGAHVHEQGGHRHEHHATRRVRIETDLLEKNDQLARQNRAWFSSRGVLALNLIGSPGAGKTRLLEETIRRFGQHHSLAVIEGDQDTDRDAARIRAAGCPVVQINTGAGCHLDAQMVGQALGTLEARPSILMIENVGNLVCPALFDLGERAKVVVMSVTEGEDKPLKYPHVFRAAEAVVLSKRDLLPYLDFDLPRCIDHVRSVNPRLSVFSLSARSGEGFEAWCEWLRTAGAPAVREVRP